MPPWLSPPDLRENPLSMPAAPLLPQPASHPLHAFFFFFFYIIGNPEGKTNKTKDKGQRETKSTEQGTDGHCSSNQRCQA
jgi:hypothetical protein